MIGFQHELMGKFLAARHLRSILEQTDTPQYDEMIKLSGESQWIDVFFFIIDELNSHQRLNQFLMDLIRTGGSYRIRLVAYAIGTKTSDLIQSKVRKCYRQQKIQADLIETPAAALLQDVNDT